MVVRGQRAWRLLNLVNARDNYPKTLTVLCAMRIPVTKKILIALGMVGFFAGGAMYYESTRLDEPTERTYTEYSESMLDCSKGVRERQIMLSSDVTACITDIMKNAVRSKQIYVLDEAVAHTITVEPLFFEACHNIGHAAGRHAYSVYGNIEELLLNIGSSCQYALGHGVLDGFADSMPDETLYFKAARACLAIDDDVTAGFCGDGLGHVAWSSTNNISDAVRRCAYLSKPNLEEACGEGVLMQIYEPAGFEPSSTLADSVNEIPSMCARWPLASKPSSVNGCYRGAGYVFSRYLVKSSRVWEEQQTMTPDLRATVLTNIEYALNGCKLLQGASAVRECNFSLARQYPPVVHYDRQLQDAACLPLGEWANLCKTWKVTIK